MLKKQFVLIASLAGVSLCASQPLFAQPLTLGLATLWSQSPYHSTKDRTVPVPLINYQDENIFFHGVEGGYYLYHGEMDQFSLIANTTGQYFSPHRAHNSAMQGLDKRHLTMMMGGEWTHQANWGLFRTALTGDVLNESNGVVWDTNYRYPLQFGALAILPGAGVTWQSKNQTNYYYGVSGSESRRTSISRYKADDSWSPYIDVSATYALTRDWSIEAGARYTHFDKEIKHSPMVDKSGQTTIWTGVNYQF
ncbi:MipA/OmpV family protein [Rosenbergiella australiborealis]|uniref:MipA/OmpV family protein n=1 Tax=Rosenbergiella australiborealis TaxID=1544696 RepID=A0ABS5T2D1_9GAMM|nr:MipA/OmpV family protein [Rosenbergiella australiborealis]MBT0726312.1 MipA/OmpV family protein [Rosenbergiella australiborealis]